jgi:hypothetical protein
VRDLLRSSVWRMGMIRQWFAARMVPSFPDRPIASNQLAFWYA